MVFICLPNDLFNDISAGVPEGDYAVDSVACERFRLGFVFRFRLHEIMRNIFVHCSYVPP